MPDINQYALAMQLAIDEGAATAALTKVTDALSSIEAKVASIGKKFVKALKIDLSAVPIKMPKLEPFEVEAKLRPFNIAAQQAPVSLSVDAVAKKAFAKDVSDLELEATVSLKIDQASKKALDVKLAKNISSVVSAAMKVGFDVVPKMQPISKQTMEIDAAATSVELPKSEQVNANVIFKDLPNIKLAASVEEIDIATAKARFDSIFRGNVEEVMASGVKAGATKAAGEIDVAVMMKTINEAFGDIYRLKGKLFDANDAIEYQAALKEVESRQEAIYTAAMEGRGELVPWAAVRSLEEQITNIHEGMRKELADYSDRFGRVAGEMEDLEIGRLTRSADNIESYIKQGTELEQIVGIMRKMEAAGETINIANKEDIEKQYRFHKITKEFWAQELKHAKTMEIHKKRMVKLGQELNNVADEGPLSWLFKDLITGAEDLRGAFNYLGLNLKNLHKAASYSGKLIKSVFQKIRVSVSRAFRRDTLKKEGTQLTKAMAEGVNAGAGSVKGVWSRLWASVKGIFKKDGVSVQKDAQKALEVKPPAGVDKFSLLSGAAKHIMAFFGAIAAIPWAAIAKFAIVGALMIALTGGLILLAQWLSTLGVEGVVALLALSVAMIGFAFALSIVSGAILGLAASATAASFAIPFILALAVAVAALALPILAATAFMKVIVELFTAFKDNIGAGFAFVGFIALLGVSLVIAGAGILLFSYMFAAAMVALAGAVMIGASMLVPAILFSISMGFVAAGIWIVSKAVEALGSAMSVFASASESLVSSLMQIPAAAAGFSSSLNVLFGSIWKAFASIIPASIAMFFISWRIRSFAAGLTKAMLTLSSAMAVGAPALEWLSSLADVFGRIAESLEGVGEDVGEKMKGIVTGLRELSNVRIAPGVAAGILVAAASLRAFGDAAGEAAPQLEAVADAGTAITEMVDQVVSKEADFDRAATIVEEFGSRIDAAFEKVSAAAVAGPFGPEGEARAETITTVRVTDEVARRAAENNRQMNESLSTIKSIMDSIGGKIDVQTLKEILKILEAHLPRISEGGGGAPVDDINRWK